MPLRVWTSRLGWYRDKDAVDITRATAHNQGEVMKLDVPGAIFAPSWKILDRYLREQERAANELGFVRPQKADHILQAAWVEYTKSYTEEMRQSYRLHRGAWKAFLARDEVTLLCVCANPLFCHRSLLAGILVKCGAVYLGERELGMLTLTGIS